MLVLARPAEHLGVGNTRRLVHWFDLDEQTPEKLIALCGAIFGPGELELLDRVTGMPCEPCLGLAYRRQLDAAGQP